MTDPWDLEDWLFDESPPSDPSELLAELAGPDLVAVPVAPTPAPARGLTILRCKHCGSHRISPRSTDAEATRVTWSCRDCGRRSVLDCPEGYERAWLAGGGTGAAE